ncbi:hypothetical protein ACJJTC_000396 [Scirpophaga incertulas]
MEAFILARRLRLENAEGQPSAFYTQNGSSNIDLTLTTRGIPVMGWRVLDSRSRTVVVLAAIFGVANTCAILVPSSYLSGDINSNVVGCQLSRDVTLTLAAPAPRSGLRGVDPQLGGGIFQAPVVLEKDTSCEETDCVADQHRSGDPWQGAVLTHASCSKRLYLRTLGSIGRSRSRRYPSGKCTPS